jgi:tetratricopeptide (TPR) repeat protein
MFGNNDNIPGNSYHNDVLLAEPSENSDKLRLVDELKNRAKGSIKQQNYPEAIQLYKKALSVIPTEDTKSAIAILHANISMCQLSIKKFQDALESSEEAITNDASYIKGYFRKGMAFASLKKYKDAMEAYTQGIKFIKQLSFFFL